MSSSSSSSLMSPRDKIEEVGMDDLKILPKDAPQMSDVCYKAEAAMSVLRTYLQEGRFSDVLYAAQIFVDIDQINDDDHRFSYLVDRGHEPAQFAKKCLNMVDEIDQDPDLNIALAFMILTKEGDAHTACMIFAKRPDKVSRDGKPVYRESGNLFDAYYIDSNGDYRDNSKFQRMEREKGLAGFQYRMSEFVAAMRIHLGTHFFSIPNAQDLNPILKLKAKRDEPRTEIGMCQWAVLILVIRFLVSKPVRGKTITIAKRNHAAREEHAFRHASLDKMKLQSDIVRVWDVTAGNPDPDISKAYTQRTYAIRGPDATHFGYLYDPRTFLKTEKARTKVVKL